MTKEQVYDTEIFPLMAQVIALCKQHKIAMLADFHLGDGLKVATATLEDEYDPSDNQIEAFEILRPKSTRTALLTTRDKDGKIVNMTAILW